MTEDTRVTKAQAAELARVSPRQINRWAQAGLIRTFRQPPDETGATTPVKYDRKEVLAAAERWAQRLADMRDVQLPEAT